MMTPDSLATRIEGIVISANDRYASQVLRIQDDLYSRLVTILKDIQVDKDGFIIQNSENRKILQLAQGEFDTFMSDSTFQPTLEKHLRVIPRADELNKDYFETVSSGFRPNANYLNALRRDTISNINTLILQDGFVSQVQSPIREILSQNVNSGGKFSGMLEQLQTYIKGNDKIEGRLLSYSRNILKDSLFQYTRSYQQSVVADLGLVFYKYSGGLMDKSRDFCIERAGGFYHEDEIRSWAPLTWAGKNKYTTESSIFIHCGGYGCGHQLIAVDISAVPEEWIDRAKKAKYI